MTKLQKFIYYSSIRSDDSRCMPVQMEMFVRVDKAFVIQWSKVSKFNLKSKFYENRKHV